MSWKDSLPEPLRDAPFLSKAESLEEAVGKLQHAANHVGNSIRLPDSSASPEALEEYRGKVMEKFPDLMPRPQSDEDYDKVLAALGKPETADKYPEVEGLSEARLAEVRAEALESGLTTKQYERLAKRTAKRDAEMAEQTSTYLKEGYDSLRAKWGDAYNDRIADLKQFLQDSEAPEPLVEALRNDAADPALLGWLDQWAQATKEKASNTARDFTSNTKLTPMEAEVKIEEIMRDPDYWDSNSTRQKSLMRRLEELETILSGS